MKNKKILITVIFAVVCAGVILAVLFIGYNKKTSAPAVNTSVDEVRSSDTLEEAVAWAGFPLRCSDRLNGITATDYSADKTSVTVNYGKAGYISKTLIQEDESAANDGLPEEDGTVYEINGVDVFFTGDEDAVSKAGWTDNSFDYCICLTDQSVSAGVMTDYVAATR